MEPKREPAHPDVFFHFLRRFQRSLICTWGRRLPFLLRLLQTPTPIRLLSYKCGVATPRHLLIFLPGIGDVPEDYQLNGFIDAVQRGGTEADMIAVDLHLGYYVRRAAFERLRHDVILPARDQGYGEIDLVGISLGGFGALYYAMQHSEDIARLVLLAPYLGDAPVIKEITAAGGLRKWHPREITEHDYQRKLWQSLKGEAGNSVLSRLYLGYGLDDKFAPANRLLADLLPQDHVVAIAGRHHWGTWIRVWENLLNGLKTQQP